MDKSIRDFINRQTAKDFDSIRLTIAVEDVQKSNRKAAKPHYRRMSKHRSKDHDVELIREIVREVVAEMNRGSRSSCDGCQNNRNNTTKKPKNIDDRFNAVCKAKNGIEYRA